MIVIGTPDLESWCALYSHDRLYNHDQVLNLTQTVQNNRVASHPFVERTTSLVCWWLNWLHPPCSQIFFFAKEIKETTQSSSNWVIVYQGICFFLDLNSLNYYRISSFQTATGDTNCWNNSPGRVRHAVPTQQWSETQVLRQTIFFHRQLISSWNESWAVLNLLNGHNDHSFNANMDFDLDIPTFESDTTYFRTHLYAVLLTVDGY